MKKKLRLIVSLFACIVCLFAFAACSGASSSATKYVSSADQNNYIELGADKWNSSDGISSGKYEKDENGKYTFYHGDTETVYATGELNGNTLTVTLSGETTSSTYTKTTESFFSKYGMFILLGVILVLIIVWMLFSGRKGKQRQKEYAEQLEALRPGHKVKTAGGICGIVVEICDDNTVILETGSESAGKSYIKMDKELIAQTDAKGPTQLARERAEEERRAAKEAQAAQREEPSKPAESPAEEPFEETAEGTADAPAEESDTDSPEEK